MKKIYFTVGPSQLYPTVHKHIKQALEDDIPSISHRGKQFEDIFKETSGALRQLLSIPSNFQIFFVSSSLEAMERILQNCVEKSSYHLVNGAFSQKFYEFAVKLKKKPLKIEVPYGQVFDFKKLKIPASTDLICVTQNETSTGVSLPMDKIYELKKFYPDKLIAIDIVSSVPYVQIDFHRIDMAFFSVQKGFGLPAGLGVLIVSPQALKKSNQLEEKGLSTGCFHSFLTLSKMYTKNQTPETPNVLYIYLLEQVVKDMLKKGIDKIRRETDSKAELIYNYFDQHESFRPFVIDNQIRSNTSIVIDTKGKSEKIIAYLKRQGLIVSSGYGEYKNTHIRIANFPQHTKTDFQRLLKLLMQISTFS